MRVHGWTSVWVRALQVEKETAIGGCYILCLMHEVSNRVRGNEKEGERCAALPEDQHVGQKQKHLT